jgi:hypothetical protein
MVRSEGWIRKLRQYAVKRAGLRYVKGDLQGTMFWLGVLSACDYILGEKVWKDEVLKEIGKT